MNLHIAMPRHFAAANGTTTPPSASVVTADMLAGIAATVSEQWRQADASYNCDSRDIHASRLSGLDNEASFAEADGPAGVLFQLGVAFGQLDLIDGNFVGCDETGAAMVRKLDRLLVRVTQWVERTSGLTRDAAGLTYYSDAKYDNRSFGEPLVEV
jgi:hypothetical protein